jgi:hypothetical protein
MKAIFGKGSRRVHVSVTLNRELSEPVAAVVDRLEGSGLHVTATEAEMGIVYGETERRDIDALSRIAGVVSVEEQRVMRAAGA